jgi:hypothetical protein
MTITSTSIQNQYAFTIVEHLARAQALGLECPIGCLRAILSRLPPRRTLCRGRAFHRLRERGMGSDSTIERGAPPRRAPAILSTCGGRSAPTKAEEGVHDDLQQVHGAKMKRDMRLGVLGAANRR